VIPKVVCCNRFDGNFNGACDEVFVCVWVLANEYSGRANLEAMVASVYVVQTGYGIGRTRSDLSKGEYAPLRIAKRGKIAARNNDLVHDRKRHTQDTVVGGSRRFGFFNFLRMRDRCKQKGQS
jgi:hypothetical protein